MLDRNGLKLRLKALDKAQVVKGQETVALEKIAADLLDGIAAEGRVIDAWEANCVYAALNALRKHRFGLARANLLHALETVRHLTGSQRPRSDLATLKKTLSDLQATTVQGGLHTPAHFAVAH